MSTQPSETDRPSPPVVPPLDSVTFPQSSVGPPQTDQPDMVQSARVPILPLTKESKERLYELLRELEMGDVADHEFTDEVMGLMSQMSADELEKVLHLLIDSS